MEYTAFCIYITPRHPLTEQVSHFPAYLVCPDCQNPWFFHPNFNDGFSDVTCNHCNMITTIAELFRRAFEAV